MRAAKQLMAILPEGQTLNKKKVNIDNSNKRNKAIILTNYNGARDQFDKFIV